MALLNYWISRAAIAVVGLMVAWAPPLQAGTIYVSTTGTDTEDGQSWLTPKATVQAGLDAAAAGDQVWVAAGTYVSGITLKAGVALYGGFAGHETDLSQRDWSANITVLDADYLGSVVTVPEGATEDTRIDGFTIRNGGLYDSYRSGGGISCTACSPTIANNTIADCYAYNGGGIGCVGSSAIITNNRISGNSGTYAGGIYCESSHGTVISRNMITGNWAGCGAGGIYATDSDLQVTNNTITRNSTDRDGGGILCLFGSLTLVNNTIAANTADWGGGISCMFMSVNIAGNTVAGNIGYSNPTAVYLDDSSGTIVNTIITANSSGIHTEGTGTLTLRHNCVFGNALSNYVGVDDPTGTDGNISVDPQMASPAYGGTHIQPGSPCVDAGDDAAADPTSIDVDGQARIIGAHIDIGADESDGTAWPVGPNVVIRVAADGDDANDGSSWASPKRTVQAAIDAAAPLGGDIWVKGGIYQERIRLRTYAYVYGGFAGTETDRAERNWARNVSVLDGGQGGTVVDVGYILNGLSALDGFTVRNGKEAYYGGGIRCGVSTATIAHNTISGNIGYGIYCNNADTSLIANNRICGNTVGGIGCDNSSPRVVNNTVTGNGGTDGAGIWMFRSSPTIINTIIAFNSSGVYAHLSEPVSVRNNCVYGNAAYDYAGLANPTGANGNISVDPRLACSFYADVHIQPDSPCVDAGDDSAVQAGWVDMDGQARVQGIHVDIGADESDGTVWPGGGRVIVRVSPQGDDANDGSSWALAKRTVQAGIWAAAATGGQVWVAAGTYMENLTLMREVSLYGGFAGSETGLSQRSWTANPTILDGQQSGSVIAVIAGVVQTTRIDGFTIRNGGSCGISCDHSSPIIANNNITGNSRSGISCSNAPAAILHNTITENISSSLGGGISCTDSAVTIVDNTIVGNHGYSGGGIYCSGSTPTISDNTIADNSASSGGGVYCSTADTAIIARNRITGNYTSTTGYGGGISCGGGSVAVTDNVISANSARDGGGIRCSGGMIISNRMSGNTATVFGGGIHCASGTPTIANNTITGSTASYGGGIYCYSSSSSTIASNTMVGNTANRLGGGIYCGSSSPLTIVNTIVAFNSSGIYKVSSAVMPTLGHNCVYGNTDFNYSGLTDPTDTNGNISADPRFVSASPGPDGTWGTADDAYGNLCLLPGAPCIDAGNNADVPADSADLDGDGNTTEPLSVDLGGGPRLLDDPYTPDTGAGTPPIVDMGAYEYRCGDINGDGGVDVADLLYFVDAFGSVAGEAAYDTRCDFGADGAVDVIDLLDLVYNFGT